VPKDGPSAGITMMSALVSAYTQRRVKHTVAMTGEITLRGLVLPVGGIKEKVLAAKRAGIQQVILPKKNEKDVKEITGETLEGIEVTYVERVDQVIDLVLEKDQIEDPAEFFRLPESEKKIIQQNDRSGVMEEPSVN